MVTEVSDLDIVENLITKNTKALVVVHYGGMPCNMERANKIAKKHNLYLIEDACCTSYWFNI